MKNRKIVIAGGTGFIGQALNAYFGRDNSIVILSRQSGDKHNNLFDQKLLTANEGYVVRYKKWDGQPLTADPAHDSWINEIDGADLVINLSGKSVNCRYHKKQRKEIIDSRIQSTIAIGDAVRVAKKPPSLWINVASATIYQHTIDAPNDEDHGKISPLKRDNMPYNFIDYLRNKKNKLLTRLSQGKSSAAYQQLYLDFSIDVCKRWEETFFSQSTAGTRQVALRTAITLGKGGALTPYLNLCKYGMGGKHGSGKQLFSWVHIEDLARMIEWLFETKESTGIYNCVAPNAVSNYSFMKTLRQVCGYKFGLPATSWMLEVGTFLVGTETELLLKSRWVVPARALREGFVFKYPLLKEALTAVISDLPGKSYHLF